MSGFLGVCFSLIVFALAAVVIVCAAVVIVMVIRAIKKHENEMKKYRRRNVKQDDKVLVEKVELENLIRRSFQLQAVQRYLGQEGIVHIACVVEDFNIDEMIKKKMEEYS